MKIYALYLSTTCALAICFSFFEVRAQTVDYASMETLMGEPVTTSATGTPQTVSDVAADMTIITADEIRQSGSRSIPQILSRVPGLDILQESATGFDVGIRGYQQAMQPNLLVLIDGRQVFSDDYSRTIWENLPVNIDDIRQIEVVKGASSALFGSNAAHGVINIITNNPLYDSNNVATITGGTQTNFTADATAMTKIGDYGGIKISAGGLYGQEFNTARLATESAVNQDPEHRYITESDTFKLTPKLDVFSELSYARSTGTEAYYNGQLAGITNTTYSIRGGASWETPYGTLKSNNYLNHAYVGNQEVSASLPFYSDTTSAFTSQLEDQFKLGSDHTFRASLEYNHKDFRLSAPQTLPTPTSFAADSKIEENNFAVGGMWLWQISDRLEITNAARLDHFTMDESGSLVDGAPFSSADFTHTINEYSINSGIVYKATDLDTLRATYARGIQLPSLLNYGFNSFNAFPGSTTQALERSGNPELNATVVTNYELGYERRLPGIFSTVKTALYYELNQNIISPFSTIIAPITVGTYTAARLREPTNVGDSQGFGGEIQLVGKSDNGFRWDTSYSYARVDDSGGVTNPPGTGATNAFGYDNSTPYHHFRVLFGYSIGSWEFDTNAQLLTSRILLRNNSVRIASDGYFSLAGRIGYKITDDITVALSAINLNQAQIAESPYPALERQAFISLSTKF